MGKVKHKPRHAEPSSRYYFAGDVMAMMECKERKAYEIIATLNKELNDKGILTIHGRVPKGYFHLRCGIELNVLESEKQGGETLAI